MSLNTYVVWCVRRSFCVRCLSLIWCSVFVLNLVKLQQKIDEASAEARLLLSSCTVEYKHLEMRTQSLEFCSVWPKPILPNPKTKYTGTVQTMENSCDFQVQAHRYQPQIQNKIRQKSKLITGNMTCHLA